MCVIIANNSGLINQETFEKCWDRNPDGFGVAYAIDGVVRVRKTLFKDKAWSIYKDIRDNYPHCNVLLHFRIGTGSKKNIENCHPFRIHKGLVMAHNGIINALPSTKEQSDTNQLRDLLSTMPKTFYKHPPTMKLLNVAIGFHSNKLVFLDGDGDFYFVNHNLGKTKDGNWFSNMNHELAPIVKWYDYRAPRNDYWAGHYDPLSGKYIRKLCGGCLQEKESAWNRDYSRYLCKECKKEYDYVKSLPDKDRDVKAMRPIVVDHVRNSEKYNKNRSNDGNADTESKGRRFLEEKGGLS